MQKLLEQIDRLIICFEEENKAIEDIRNMERLIINYKEQEDHEFVELLEMKLRRRRIDLDIWQTIKDSIINEMKITDLGQIVLKELQL